MTLVILADILKFISQNLDRQSRPVPPAPCC